tara:strand:+ start:575 stop:757 length:183 start_codon:yes stop_codon:yes gene_type:complete
MKKFEYQTVYVGEKGQPTATGYFIDFKLNQYGKEGWELVNIIRDDSNELTAVYKRELKDD